MVSAEALVNYWAKLMIKLKIKLAYTWINFCLETISAGVLFLLYFWFCFLKD